VMDKPELRWVWDLLEGEGVARFPGAQGRIPNFDAGETARRLASLPVWRAARAIKCNPDSSQKPVRLRALQEGKVVYAGCYPCPAPTGPGWRKVRRPCAAYSRG
jgi:5-formyltetrahydrofolate cyclo-ligase